MRSVIIFLFYFSANSWKHGYQKTNEIKYALQCFYLLFLKRLIYFKSLQNSFKNNFVGGSGTYTKSTQPFIVYLVSNNEKNFITFSFASARRIIPIFVTLTHLSPTHSHIQLLFVVPLLAHSIEIHSNRKKMDVIHISLLVLLRVYVFLWFYSQ